MQDTGAGSESAVSEMQDLRNQMLAMQRQLTQTQEKLNTYERTSLVLSRDGKAQEVEARSDKHFKVADDEKDLMYDDRLHEKCHDMNASEEDSDDAMHVDYFTHANRGKKSSCTQRMHVLASGRQVPKAEFDKYSKNRNALLEVENEVGTLALTEEERQLRLQFTKQINGLPTAEPCKSEMERVRVQFFSPSTEEENDDVAKTHKNSKLLAKSYNEDSIIYNDTLMFVYDVSHVPEVQAICKFLDWPALKKHFEVVALKQTDKDLRNMYRSLHIDSQGQYAGLVQISVFYHNRLDKKQIGNWKFVTTYTFLASVHGISQLRRGRNCVGK